LTLAPATTSIYRGAVSGAGNLKKLGPGKLVLDGANTLSGQTTIGAGSLILNGHLASAQVRAEGGILGGCGSIAGQVTMLEGSLLDLSIHPKPLSVNRTLVLMPGSTTRVELDPASGASGRVHRMSVALYAGVLLITNISPPCVLTNGQRFQLFGATRGSGNFSQIRPDPGPSLAWQFDASKGELTVVGRP